MAAAGAWKLPPSACPPPHDALSPRETVRLRTALKEAKQQARKADNSARKALAARQEAEARMLWYKKRETQLLASRRKLESQNEQAMNAVSYAHEVVIAMQKSLSDKVRLHVDNDPEEDQCCPHVFSLMHCW